MINKDEMNSDFKTTNKNVKRTTNEIIQQNRKIHEIDEKVGNVDDKMKITEKYLSGFSSFFGFFPKLFSSSKKKEIKVEARKDEKSAVKQNNQQPIEAHVSEKKKFEDVLENEIYEINSNAKKIREQIDLSMKGTNSLDKKIDITNQKAEKLKEEAKKIEKGY